MRSPAPLGVGNWAVGKMISVKHACSCVQLFSLCTLLPGIGLRCPSAAPHTHDHPRAWLMIQRCKDFIFNSHVIFTWLSNVKERNRGIKKFFFFKKVANGKLTISFKRFEKDK